MKIQPVILCGGAGSRLWPLSRPDRPKQFASLVGSLTTFQLALTRVRGGGRPLVVSSPDYGPLIREQAKAVGIEPELIFEPEMRDSAPAIAAAAAYSHRRYPDRVIVVQPADHQILDLDGFERSLARAIAAAEAGAIVTFGIPPTHPSTGFGYIKPGAAMAGVETASWVERFVEKPALPVAESYLRNGYLWNSGIFVFRPDSFAQELRTFAPELAQAAEGAVEAGRLVDGAFVLDRARFAQAPKRSIDYALLEHTRAAAVVPASFDWSDLGTWPSLKEVIPADADGNILTGSQAFALASRHCFVRSDSLPVMVFGAQNLSVIVEPDVVLVCSDAAAPDMKTALDALKAAGRPQVSRCSSGAFRYGRPASLAAASRELSAWLSLKALPLWSAFGVDYAGFGFFEALDHGARPLPLPRRCRVQPRQLSVFAAAGAAGWPGPWRAAVEQGTGALLAVFRRPDGLFRTLVDAAGAPLDETAALYDQAFALFGLAWAAKALPATRDEREADALRCLAALQASHRLPAGAYGDPGTPLRANPLMHLLEAALLWEGVGDSPAWAELADELVQVTRDRLIERPGGFLREEPLEPGALEAAVEPGHQFEWAWLLALWAQRRQRPEVLAVARRLYRIGRAHGLDAGRNVAVDVLHDDLTVAVAQARLWPQAERLKAALCLARLAPDAAAKAALEQDALAAAGGLAQYLDMPLPGLWRDKLRANGTFVEEAVPASSFYHIVHAILELERYCAA